MRDALEEVAIGDGAVEWRGDGEQVRLTAAVPVVREALLVAIDEAGERVARGCTDLLRSGGAELDAVRDALDDLAALLESFSAVR